MSLLNKLVKTLDIWLPSEEKKHFDKGVDFEKYVAQIFESQKKYFSILDWTKDTSYKRNGIQVESNKNPDLIIQYKPTKEKFAIECKFRSYMIQSEKIDDPVIKWSYPDQIKRYNDFSKTNNIPVFIIIGLGGKPDNPEFMFCVPLKEAKYPEIFPSVLEKYERPPSKPFFWKDNKLQ